MSIRMPVVVAALLALVPVAPAAAATPPVGQLVSSTITTLPTGAIRSQLLKQVATVNAQVRAGKLCPARGGLARMRATALAGHAAPVGARAAIAAATLQAESSLLGRAATRRCGGDAATNGSDPALRDIADSAAGVTLRLEPPAASFAPQLAHGAPAVTAEIAQLPAHGRAFGDPEVATTTTLVAVPRGDTLALGGVTARSYVLHNVPLAPYEDTGGAQTPTPFYLQGDYAPQPFTRSAKFSSRIPTPARVATLGREFNFRGTPVVPVTVSATRYDGAARSLQVFTSVNVKLTFKGAGTVFGPSWVGSDANASFTAAIANASQVVKNPAPPPKAPSQHCPTMLLISDKAYAADANRLAIHKDQIGISTQVLTTATLTTQDQIHDAIQRAVANSVNHCGRPLSFVLLLGSTTAIPPYLRHSTRNATYTPLIATDYPYFVPLAGLDQVFPVAEVCYGRLAARSEAEAKTMVDKIIAYETSPPNGNFFVNHTSVAGMFQYTTADNPDPTRESNPFMKPLESLRNRMQALGKAVDRFYVKEDGAKPRYYADGSLLPADLRSPSFDWNATPEAVTLAINEGRSVVFHDDHGHDDGSGWGDPAFNDGTISELHNGTQLPFIVSVDCDTGDYQNSTESFAERLEDYTGGGAIGVIAASRMTNTGGNVDYALAVGSALYGGLIEGGSHPAVATMGDVLFSAQVRFAEADGFFLDPMVVDYRRQYNLFGDPSLRLVK
jgi:hypothetical protein